MNLHITSHSILWPKVSLIQSKAIQENCCNGLIQASCFTVLNSIQPKCHKMDLSLAQVSQSGFSYIFTSPVKCIDTNMFARADMTQFSHVSWAKSPKTPLDNSIILRCFPQGQTISSSSFWNVTFACRISQILETETKFTQNHLNSIHCERLDHHHSLILSPWLSFLKWILKGTRICMDMG